jgi:serine protease AprX
MNCGNTKISLCLLAILLLSTKLKAQNQYAYRISFTDKNGVIADIHTPSTFLSAKALNRRSAQHLSIDSTDLPIPQIYIDSVLKLSSGKLHVKSHWLNQCVILVNDTSNIKYVRSKPFVKGINYVAGFTAPLHIMARVQDEHSSIPINRNRSLLKTTGGVGYYGDAYDQISLANGQYLHDKGYRGAGKTIAVLDAGFNTTNTLAGYDSLRISGRIVDTYNFKLDTSDVYGYSDHGTEVLSTMAGIITGQYVGTAPDASYALYITEDALSEQPYEMDNLVAAMERADSIGVDIISISLGYNTFDGGIGDLSYSDLDGKSTIAAMGVNVATSKGILVVSSAGNEGGGTWDKILTPGDADSALTIGSVDISKTHVVSSGNGPNAAGQIKPDVCMLGAPSMVFNTSGTISAIGGTSLATPELAGLAACLWEAKPSATPYEIRNAIRKSADHAASPDNHIGYGVPDFGIATQSLSYLDPPILVSAIPVVYPNPFFDKIALSIYALSSAQMDWNITDLQGKSVLSGKVNMMNGTNNLFEISIPDKFPSGMYFLHIVTPEYNNSWKLVHQHK